MNQFQPTNQLPPAMNSWALTFCQTIGSSREKAPNIATSQYTKLLLSFRPQRGLISTLILTQKHATHQIPQLHKAIRKVHNVLLISVFRQPQTRQIIKSEAKLQLSVMIHITSYLKMIGEQVKLNEAGKYKTGQNS